MLLKACWGDAAFVLVLVMWQGGGVCSVCEEAWILLAGLTLGMPRLVLLVCLYLNHQTDRLWHRGGLCSM